MTSGSQLIRCACCKDDTPEDQGRPDPDLGAPVCPDCLNRLRNAKALLAMPFSAAYEDVRSMPISIKGCYHGADAGDNKVTS